MEVHDNCNMCARIRSWYEKQPVDPVDDEFEDATDDGPRMGTCQNCHEYRSGENQIAWGGAFLCNICFWRHVTGLEHIELPLCF